MKGRGRKLRLSPNEEARIIREEKERRRKLRLVQVREQAKVNAAKVREEVKNERAYQLSLLAAEIKDEWEEEKAEKVRKLQEIHVRSMRHVGDAHVNATQQEPTDVERAFIEQQNLQRAAKRHLDAIKKMKEEKAKKEEEAKKHIVARQAALELERERAAEVAALPAPDPDPLQDVTEHKVKPIKLTDVNAFSLTHFHMEDYAVERAQPAEQTDARQAALHEQQRLDQAQDALRVAAHERQEKARVRHQHARKRELLSQDYDTMLHDLSDLRRADIARRQQVVAKIPRAVYQAPHRRLEEKEEEQREMEAAFEDMYMAATENQGDLTLALDAHPPPSTPAGTSVLDLTPDPGHVDAAHQVAPRSMPLRDLTNLSSKSLPQGSDGKANDSALSRLMGRIQAQRETWASRTDSGVELAPSPRPTLPLVPDHDVSSTATGGSLTQYTLTSGTAASRSVSTPGESATDTTGMSSVTSLSGSRVSSMPTSQQSVTSVTVTESELTTTTEATLEDGTVSSTTTGQSSVTESDTLLHPMELAAKVRQIPLSDKATPLASFLNERKLTEQPNLEQLVSDFRQEQQRLERERKKLEKKMKELESQSSIKPSPLETAQKYLQEPRPLPPDEPSFHSTEPVALFMQENTQRQAEVRTAATEPLLPYAPSSVLSQTDKVKLYQQRALERYRERQRSSDSSMLGKSIDSGSVVTSRSLEQSPIAQIPITPTGGSPSGLGSFEGSLTLTSPSLMGSLRGFGQSVPRTSSVQQSISPKQAVGSPYSGKSGNTDWSQHSSYHSQEFDARQAALKAQLAEIEHQKAEILARQQRHQDEMHQTKERWQRELEQYSLSDSLAGDRSLSLLTTNNLSATTADQKQLGTGTSSDDAVDEDLLRYLNDLQPLQATDHKYKIKRHKPTAKSIKVPNKSPVMSHELSTIQELDTPATEKKDSSHTQHSSKDKSVARYLFGETDRMQTLAEDYDSSNTFDTQGYTPQYNNLSPQLEPPTKPQQLSQYFTKEPSEVDVLSAGRSDDFADADPIWNVTSWVGLDSKTVERPMPSIDRVEEIHRMPNETPGELVMTPKLRQSQDFRDSQDEFSAVSTDSSTGQVIEDSVYHPNSEGITVKPTESEFNQRQVDYQPTESITNQRFMNTHREEKTPDKPPVHPLPRTPTKPHTSTESPSKFEFNTHYQPLKAQEKDKNWKKELAQYNMSYLTPPKMSPARPTDKIVRCITTRAFGCERPVKGTAKTKQEMEEKHRANLIPPKSQLQARKILSPEENLTPSRIREMFERSGKDLETSPIPKDKPYSRFSADAPQFLASTPSNDKRVSRLGPGDGATVVTPIESDGLPSMISTGQASLLGFSKSHEKSVEVNQSSRSNRDVARTVSSERRDEVSTMQSELSQQRLESDADSTAKTPGNISFKTNTTLEKERLGASSMRSDTLSTLSMHSNTPSGSGMRSDILSALGMHSDTHGTLGMRSDTHGAPGMRSDNLGASGMRSDTALSLSQHTLEDSRPVSAAESSPADYPRSSQGQKYSSFQPLMEMSRSSVGSEKSAQKSPFERQAFGGHDGSQSVGQTELTKQYVPLPGDFSMEYGMQLGTAGGRPGPSQEPSSGPSQNVMDLALDISKQAEAAMEKYDRLMEESCRLRQQYDAEEKTLMAETRARSQRHSAAAVWEQNMKNSLERLTLEETGISDEPDLTLVSSTPQKASLAPMPPVALPDPLAGSQQEGSNSEQPGSLLSFEQHEQSLATLSSMVSSMTSSLTRPAETLTPYASSSSNTTSSLTASGPRTTNNSKVALHGNTAINNNNTGMNSNTSSSSTERTSIAQENQKHLSRTLSSWKKNNSLQAQSANPAGPATAASISMTTKTSADQKKREREMKERTERLYGQLEDVKQHRLEEQRKQEYASNRQRKLDYQKSYQDQLKRKFQDKKK